MLVPEPTVTELEQLKKASTAYLSIEENLDVLRKEVKELNSKKKVVYDYILEFMRKYNHEEIYLGNGQFIHYKKNEVKEPLSQREIQRRMEKLRIGDDIKKTIFERNKIEKDTIKKQTKTTKTLAL